MLDVVKQAVEALREALWFLTTYPIDPPIVLRADDTRSSRFWFGRSPAPILDTRRERRFSVHSIKEESNHELIQ